MNNRSSVSVLKIILVLVGAFGIFLSIDFGFGGFQTLGWQGTTSFVESLDEMRFGVQDSHFRFLSGVFGGISVFMIFAVTNLQKYQQVLKFSLILILAGGIMRFTSGDFEVLFGVDILVALFAEIVLMLILYFWLDRTLKHQQSL